MYAQITRFKVTPEQLQDAKRIRQDVDPMIRAVPGLKQHLTLFQDDGTALVIAIRDGGEPSEQTKAKIAEIWRRFDRLLAAEPQRETFEVYRDLRVD